MASRLMLTIRIIVDSTLICGGVAVRDWPKIRTGKVVVLGPETKYVMMKSSIERANDSRNAARIPGMINGNVTLRNVRVGFAPRSIAASSRVQSKPRNRALTVSAT